MLPKPAHKLWRAARTDGNVAARLTVRSLYYNNNNKKQQLEWWCLGITDHPQWLRDADELKEAISNKRHECAWAIHDLTSDYLEKEYTNSRESRSGAMQGVVSVLRKHETHEETVNYQYS